MANASNHSATTLFGNHPYIELDNQGQIVSFSLNRDLHKLGRDQTWADLIVPSSWGVVSSCHAILRREGKNYRIYDGNGSHPSTNGIWANHVRVTPTEGYLLQNSIQLSIGQDPNNCVLLTYTSPQNKRPATATTQRKLSLESVQSWPVKLGREQLDSYASMQLDAPTVSRLHATISRNGNSYAIADRSTNGTFVNSQRIDQPTRLNDGDKIQIGPFTLIYRQSTLEIFDQGNQIRLDAHELLRRVKDKAGKEKTILNRISLPIEPGQLVALVGGSGTGKSTLLKTLLGIEPTNQGTVLLNGDDLQQHFNIYRSQIGYVPQDDIVHRNLTVEEVLTYACRLRLPPQTPVQQLVDKTLKQVKLDFVRHNLVGNLSGGQRKRVSIAVELLADPKLFFLDEPTSGLDPGLDKEMMTLLRELAHQGRTIILVTHATSNIEVCDRIVFMGRGGNLCYFGPPVEAMDFFEMPSNELKYFADIYLKLDLGQTPAAVDQNVSNWRSKFQSSKPYYQYVQQVLSPPPKASNSREKAKGKKIPPLTQLGVLASRYFKSVGRDRASLALTLLAAPLGIALIAFTLGDETPLAQLEPLQASQAPLALRVLFIFTCAAILVGLLSSVQEIVKEASIYARERLVNLGTVPYLGSKLLVRSLLAALQTAIVVVVILLGFESPQSDLLSWPIGVSITTFLTIWATIGLGLMVSALVKNETEANNSLTLIFLPQIILSGVLFDLEGFSSKLSWLTISRWSVGAYGALVDVNGMVPQVPGGTMALPFSGSDVYSATWGNLGLNWLVLILHGVVYLAIALQLQKRKDKL